MPRAFVVNASPLILLSRIGYLGLLEALAETVVVPRAVLEEIEAGDDRDGAATEIGSAQSIDVVADLELPDRIKVWELGAGESQVIARGLEDPRLEGVLDDRAARRCAQSVGVAYTGTLGIILLARQYGLIPKARPVVEELKRQNIRLSPALIEAALAEVGE